MKILDEFRNRIPWLKTISDEIYYNLDPSDWKLTEININELEQEFEGHVMTYKLTGMNLNLKPEKHLCAHLFSKKLNKLQLEKLKQYELNFKRKNVSLAVYEKPIKIRKPRLILRE